jgi:hypothetical protein
MTTGVGRVGLTITFLLYLAILTILLFLTIRTEASTTIPKIQIPTDITTLYYRVDKLEEWKQHSDGDRLVERVGVLEDRNKLEHDNRALLWGLIGTAGLNILGTALLGLVTTRKNRT